jgi:N-acetylmuramoyl-L-alanine amidase
LIVLHCSDSDIPSHDNVAVITQWHRKRGFKNIGYHYYINKSGVTFKGRPDNEVGAHTEGFNSNSIGICLGGKDYFTEAQFEACAKLCSKLLEEHGLSVIDILGHRDLNGAKTCPNFELSKVTSRIIKSEDL